MDKVVIITGAGSGMGKSIAIKYATLKAQLSIVDIDAKGLEETAEVCLKLNGGKILSTAMDITTDNDVKTLVDSTVNKFGRIDILINCAGIMRASNLLDPNVIEVYDKIMSVNLRSIVLLTSLCAPYLIKSKGCVINISSLAGILAIDNLLSYAVTKAGLIHFTKCIALELASHGVRVNAILPGLVSSNLYVNLGLTKEESVNYIGSVATTTPLKHPIETTEIADLVLFLTSNEARSITGASYVIDAGMSLTGYKNIL